MGAHQLQHLTDSFLTLLPPPASSAATPLINSSCRAGPLSPADLSPDLKRRLPEIFQPNKFLGFEWNTLYKGDISSYGGDHSAADMALVGYLAREGHTPDEVDQVFRASGLYRDKWDEMRGAQTYGERTIAKAFEGVQEAQKPAGKNAAASGLMDIARHRPNYVPGGMPARRFVGPFIDRGMRLFPAASLSTLVALGAVGKTTLLIAIGAHLAAGKPWNGQRVQRVKVVMFFVEELQEELDRKVSAVIDSWLPAERQQAIDNLLMVSLLGQDARLTTIDRGQYRGSGMTEKMIALIEEFGGRDGLVILDHMQGFASGDLNISETATSICREANKIVEATGVAVVFAAHIAKANINAATLEQGFAVGSLAFENATRQMSGMLPMPEEDAKKYGLDATRKEYVWLGIPKNSYGASDGGMWLRKVHVPKYHTVVMEPVALTVPLSAVRKSENEQLADRLTEYISRHLRATKSQLDGIAGNDGPLKASKDKVRDVLRGLLDTGVVESCPVTDAARQEHGIPKQVKEILRLKPADSSPPKLARRPVMENAPAGLKPLVSQK